MIKELATYSDYATTELREYSEGNVHGALIYTDFDVLFIWS